MVYSLVPRPNSATLHCIGIGSGNESRSMAERLAAINFDNNNIIIIIIVL